MNYHFYYKLLRDEYLQLINDFVNFKIDAEKFDKLFCKKVQFIEKRCLNLVENLNYEDLRRFKPNSMSDKFLELISEIYLCCNEFTFRN